MPHANGDITAAQSFYDDRQSVSVSEALTAAYQKRLNGLLIPPMIESAGEWYREQRRAQDAKRLAIRDEDIKRFTPDHQALATRSA